MNSFEDSKDDSTATDVVSVGDPQPEAEPDRRVQPVDDEQPPRLPFPVVGIGASAGGIEAAGEFFDVMPPDSGMAFVLIQHLPPQHQSMMAEILGRRTKMIVQQVEDGMPVEPDHVYVIRPGHVLTIRDGKLRMGPKLGTPKAANRPVDDFFRSLAEEQRERAIIVLLSGMGSNGTAGAQAIKAVGGLCVAQDPDSAQYPSMPRHLIDAGYADYIARPADLPAILLGYAGHPYARGGRESDAEEILQRDQQKLHEILTTLRTRTRHDFTGYKKPTLLRRIQRRMGVTHTEDMGDYLRRLRQTPTEASALADDLLIHVTGFFRDQDAWEALRKEAVVPLIESREPGGTVRAWVTACSSGEEAYSMAMLLSEEAARAGKPLDIKVFATDMTDRQLNHARAGAYPGGIESEVSPERLERFFTRDDEMYVVRTELRERVVFASQNVLQDPPFSRIDIASCRNLLIYLEPDVQQRVLSLLHFGLREGGVLFLGSAETVAGAEELFEPVDKKHRLYRRIGPMRQATVEFPLPHAVKRVLAVEEDAGQGGTTPFPVLRRFSDPRPPLDQLMHRVLLDQHTPPAVTIDRDGRILYYHGDTRPFLQQVSGEPTRELMLLIQDGLRSAVRTALHQATSQNVRAMALDGWVDLSPSRRLRVAVTVSPIATEQPGTPEYFVVSFADRGEAPPLMPQVEDSSEETRRLRIELRRTIEELQASNEELKASNEEVMSINEELQSANEELETSKEEMQSLNEELSAVNSQLRSKMDELQSATNDLGSLLVSTDIAVLFLDTAFHIRRYTPAVGDLVEILVHDVGRPLANLTRKFDDAHLDNDARAVLERLAPIEREVEGTNGRFYLRRVTPYRTTDNRIDGVVITFVDISMRRKAEADLRDSEQRLRLILESATDFGILTLRPDRIVTTWSSGAEAAFGYTADEIVGTSGDRLFTPEDRAAGAPELEVEQAQQQGRAADERWHLRKDGTRFFASGVLTRLGGDDGSGYVKVFRDLTDRKQMEDELRQAHDELEIGVQERTRQLAEANAQLREEIRVRVRIQAARTELVQRLTTAQEDERRRISRDLHDHTGQTLVGLQLALNAVGKHPLPEEARERLRNASELTNELGRQMHDLALQLRPVALDDLGLEAALRSLVDQWSHRTDCPVEYESSCIEKQRLPSDVETVLYRVVQESLTNVSRHSSATQVTLTLTCTPDTARLVIEDNGVGFDPEAVPPNRLGLLGMNERVTAVGGTLQIESTPGGPTTLFARIPLPTASAGVT